MNPKILAVALALVCASASASAASSSEPPPDDCADSAHDAHSGHAAEFPNPLLKAADAHKLQSAIGRVVRATSALGYSEVVRDMSVLPYVGNSRLPLDASVSPGGKNGAPRVSITTALIEDASEDELVAVLGHEVSHVLRGDASEAAYLRVREGSEESAGFGMATGVLGGKLVMASWAAGGIFGVLGAGALYVRAQCTQTQQFEKTADLFGAQLLTQEGKSREDAFQIVASMVQLLHQKNPPVRRRFWECYVPGNMVHPTAQERIDYLQENIARI